MTFLPKRITIFALTALSVITVWYFYSETVYASTNKSSVFSQTKGIINLRALLSNAYYYNPANPKELYLYIDLKSGKAITTQEKPPLNISLVLDRSGSMSSERKLEFAKQAVKFVIDNVASTDNVSVVMYDHEVKVVAPSGKIEHKDVLKNKIDVITSGGSTNLSGGMLEGYTQVKSTYSPKLVNRVLLMSDGLQNTGITDPMQIKEIARKKNTEDGISISTFGVGSDFNEDLMTNIAEYGSGNYYYIDSSDKIPQIIAQELKGLLSVVAQNAKLTINYPNAYLSLKRVYGYPHTAEDGKISVDFKDIFSEEQKAVLIKFEITKPIDKEITLESILSYDDAATFNREEIKVSNTIVVVSDEATYKSGFDEEVKRNIILFQSNDLMHQAMKLVDEKKYEEAKKVLREDSTYLEESFKTVVPDSSLKKQYNTIIKYKTQVNDADKISSEEFKKMQKFNKSENYNIYKKK